VTAAALAMPTKKGLGGFARAGNVNLEERVDGIAQIDPVVLEELRELT